MTGDDSMSALDFSVVEAIKCREVVICDRPETAETSVSYGSDTELVCLEVKRATVQQFYLRLPHSVVAGRIVPRAQTPGAKLAKVDWFHPAE